VVWRRDWRRDPERIARRLLSNFEEQIVPTNNSDSRSLDSKARRAAARAGLMAQKSRLRCGPSNDLGGYRLVDRNRIVAGERFDLTAGDVIEYCSD